MARSEFTPETTTLPQLWERQVKDRGEHEFLVYEDARTRQTRRFTYREFDARVNQCANALAARGIGEKSLVALYLDNCIEFVECMLALAKMGSVAVPVDASSAPVELGRILRLCRAATLVTRVRGVGGVRPHLPVTVEDIVVVGRGDDADEAVAADLPHLDELSRRESAVFVSNPRVGPLDLCEILFTSGTTVEPKGVMITHANIVFSGAFVNWELDMTPEDRYMTSMVAARVNYQLSALAPVLTLGATLIMISHYRATCFWQQARLHRATLVQGMAMIAATMLRQPVDPDERDHHVREIHYFLPLSTKDKEAFESRFGVPLLNNYGSTECLIGAITDSAHGPRRWPSIGRAGPGYAVRIVDENGTDLPDGHVGELVLHGVPGVSLMAGYWGDPEATAAAIDEDGWYYTRDYAYVEDGWVYFVDRRVDLIKRSGESVSSAQVESVIGDLDGVCEVAVIGVPDSVRGQAVKAFVVPASGAELSVRSVLDHCERRLAAYKVPTVVEFVDDLPRGTYGKVQKHLLAISRNHPAKGQ
ncbi:AMP-binding protein [Actinomyces sp. B33]|uniref:AMP-binding protein n=1 Tax=Actinomyces sp. B33 TaxID=2942131 RepID=UPI0023421C98|nr:AMP-binding protein [Actinomyces sp. B33]MDC4233037.1 AMP-binding protein [Actinomyces sp. B33]